jgi:short-subunit dehydrogenase
MDRKVVVITGASGGIGAATAELLARRGMSLVLVARREDALRAVAARCGDALPLVADVTQRADVKRVVDQALTRFGHVDVWINNVGQGISVPPSRLTDEDIDEIMRVNVKTSLYGMQEILPHFKARNSGHIINISSMLGRVPLAVFRSAYTASKHFLNALTAGFRTELQTEHPGMDIQFTLVSPGVVRTDFGKNARHGGPDSHTLPNSQSAEEVAEVIANVIETRRPDVYTRPGAHDMVVKYYDGIGEDP